MPGRLQLTPSEAKQLRSLEARVEVALEAAGASEQKAPEALRDLLVEALVRLQALASGSEERPDAVESVERALAALDAWGRWKPSARPSA